MLHQGGCPNNDELDAHAPVHRGVIEILASKDEEAQETQQAKDTHTYQANKNGEWQHPGPSSPTSY